MRGIGTAGLEGIGLSQGVVVKESVRVEGRPSVDAALALEESEARYNIMVEHSPDAIVILDMTQERFVDCNAVAVAFFETDRDTLLQHGPASLSPPTQEDGRLSSVRAREYIQRSLEGEVPAFEWVHRTLNGRNVPCEVRLVRLPDQGRPLVLGCITDISWRKRMEQEQAALASRLRTSKKLESLGLLAGGVAHDFNNLLAVILGYADLTLESDGLDARAQETLGRLRGAAVQARKLTDQLLIYVGRAPKAQEDLDLSRLVGDELSILAVAVRSKGRLTSDLEASGCHGLGGSGQLQQVILNLVGNACDALSGPSGSIHVSTACVTLGAEALQTFQVQAEGLVEGRFALLEVSDTGCGMSEEVLERSFDPFYTTKAEGHGLGLSTVVGIIRSHGGALRVSSKRGRGTVFSLLLPLTGQAPAQVSEDQSHTQWRGWGRVLVADDQPAVREVTEALLEALGFEVTSVSSGIAAVAAVQAEPDAYRLALLDVNMGGMDGVEARGALQALAPEIRVLLVSGFAHDEANEILRDEGPEAFMRKPYGLEDLRRRLALMFSD